MRSVLTRASAALDRGVVRFIERRMAPRTPEGKRLTEADSRGKLIELAAAYNDGTRELPSRFFPTPALPQPMLEPQGDGPLGTQVVDLTFRSDYVPFLPLARDTYSAVAENQTAHVRWWTGPASQSKSGSLHLGGRGPVPGAARSKGSAIGADADSRSIDRPRGRPTIVMLHGWGGGNHRVTAASFVVPYWLRHGFDVAAFQLPFHGARAPAGSAPLSPLWPSPNPLRTNEGFGHAIYDLRALALWLRSRGASAVGVMGMSLGGYTTALWASVAGPSDPGGVEFAVAMIPAVSMARLFWRHGESNPMRLRALKAGITEELLADAFAVHSPLARPPRIERDRRFVVAGRGDRITPPDQAEELAAHWQTDIEWFDGGHLAQVGRGDALRAIRRKLATLDLPGRAFRPS